MSYLNVPRLTFSGKFQADPSTVNNDPNHYNNATFKPNYQDYSTATDLNGWWNPDGTGNWRFVDCTITSVTYNDGNTVTDPKLDPVIGMSIMDSDSRVAGKIVDLDPQQQMVSQLWGLIVRIVSKDGVTLMKGDYTVAPFTNIWFSRSVDQAADGAAAALYQSVIKNITWNDTFTGSRFLNELRDTSTSRVSIQFTVDRFNGDNTAAEFTMGRIAGGIGPYISNEPTFFVPGRQLFPTPVNGQPASTINYAVAIVDEQLNCIVLDMANSLQFSTGGVVNETRNLHLAIQTGSKDSPAYIDLGPIRYDAPDWYMQTSGLCTFPLSGIQLQQALSNPLAIVQFVSTPADVFTSQTSTTLSQVFFESSQYVRADKFVFKLNPGEKCNVSLYSTNLGKPYPNAQVQLATNNSAFGPTPPNVGTPANGITFKSFSKTDAAGKAVVEISASDPGNPRKYIDGQIYGIAYNFDNQSFRQCNQANFISFQVYDALPEDTINNPSWADLQPIMQQYANLYPLMSKGIFNLANQQVVDDNAQILKLVFSKDLHDPNYMPATRDLSRDKTRMILNYLDNVLKNQH